MKEKLKKVNFNILVVVFFGLLVLLAVFNALLSNETKHRINSILDIGLFRTEQTFPEFQFEEDNDHVDEGNELPFYDNVDFSQKKENLLDNVPYYTDAFNVVYYHGENKFIFYVNPASSITEEDVYKWMESFADIESYKDYKVEVVKWDDQGPPVG